MSGDDEETPALARPHRPSTHRSLSRRAVADSAARAGLLALRCSPKRTAPQRLPGSRALASGEIQWLPAADPP